MGRRKILRYSVTGSAQEPVQLGENLAQAMILMGAADFIAEVILK
jgi:hypothetical protein